MFLVKNLYESEIYFLSSISAKWKLYTWLSKSAYIDWFLLFYSSDGSEVMQFSVYDPMMYSTSNFLLYSSS